MINRLPPWFRQNLPQSYALSRMHFLSLLKVKTVCIEAKCPNLSSCFRDSCLTFLILGDTCTRNCRFCGVKRSNNELKSLDLDEPRRIAETVKELKLCYVVITSVTRDDLEDGGAAIFAKTIKLIRKLGRDIKIEVLIPDFKAQLSSLKCVLEAGVDLIGHNIETVERLYPNVRPEANYNLSLELLSNIKELCPYLITKSSLMLGLGEREDEVRKAMEDLIKVQCDILAIGQYLSPSLNHYPVKEFIEPKKFRQYQELGYSLGFKAVLSGPLVRSSYRAEEVYHNLKASLEMVHSG